MTNISLDIDTPTNPLCRYSIGVDGCTVTIWSNKFSQRSHEFPSPTVASIFANEFAIEAIESRNDNGWLLRVKRRIEYLAETLQPQPLASAGVNGS